MQLSSFKFIAHALILSFVWLGFSSNLPAQNNQEIDSLKNLLKEEVESAHEAKLCSDLAILYLYDSTDSALIYAQQGLVIAKSKNDSQLVSEFYQILGAIYELLNQYEVAISYFEKALEGYKTLHDSVNMAEVYHNLGFVIAYENNQAKSLEKFLEALKIAEEIKDTALLSDIYYNVATFYEYLPNFEMARFYYEKTAVIEESLGMKSSLASTYATLAYVNAQLGENRIASAYAKKGLGLLTRDSDSYYIGFSYSVLADYYLQIENRDSAEKYINLSEKLAIENSDDNYQADVLKQRGELAIIRGQYRDGLEMLDRSLAEYTSLGNVEPLRDIHRKRSEAFIALQQYENGHKALQLANQYADSLRLDEVARMLGVFEQETRSSQELKNLELQQKIERQEANHEILLAKKRLALSYIFWGFVVLMLAFAIPLQVALNRRNRELNRKNRIIEEQKKQLEQNIGVLHEREAELILANATKDKFFSIIAHDLKNPFNTLIGYSDLLLEDQDLRNSEDFERIAKRLNKSAEKGYVLLTNLLKWAQSQTGDLLFKPQLQSLTKLVEHNIHQVSEVANAKGINIKFEPEGDFEVGLDSDMMDTVVRNLLNNAIKFSYPDGEIWVSVRKNGKGYITEIKDFGVGLNAEELDLLFNYGSKVQKPGTNNESGSGLGLILCKEFLDYHKGEIWVDCKEGEGCTFGFLLHTED